MIEYDPVATFLKIDPNMYCRIRSAVKQLNIEGFTHVKGHQDRSSRTRNNISRLNIMAERLATQAVNEENSVGPEWHESLGPILKINGKAITQKEGMCLGIAEAAEELYERQRSKFNLIRARYNKID